MKKIFIAIAFFAVMILPAISSAQMKGESVHVSPMVGAMFPDSKFELKSGVTYNLGVGYNFNSNWGLEVMGGFSPNLSLKDKVKRLGYDGKADISNVKLNVLYHFDTGTNFTPYVTLGGGYYHTKYDDNGNFGTGAINAGLGFKYFFNDVVALRLEASDFLGFRRINKYDDHNNKRTNSPTVMAGLTFQFAPNTECSDEDNDGVCDQYDKCPGTPAGYKVDANGCPIILAVTMDIKFDFDKAVIKKQYMPEVAKVAEIMKENPQSNAVIEGYTDNIGSKEYNVKLSQRRAHAVKAALTEVFGINPARLDAIGYGESNPIADNSTESGRAINRRVVGVVAGPEVR